ncbi:hypothetical protein [Leptolyngbya sp. PCC 6406]|uniref:hypothetical protein n=1 Tax=Leptolyngbya sp. PCC 6406 TaxID=1173264 RepID=UPI0002AC92D6|nr:hypothetical protein [Leptolyngbya sp. PCC 6406]
MRWTMTWKPVAFLVMLGLTATLAACGGSDTETTEPADVDAIEEPAEGEAVEGEEAEGEAVEGEETEGEGTPE